ncbi:recombinase family protein [Oscillospiraceae bacterium PP1C4]
MIAFYARQSVERENSVSIETQLDFCKSMMKPNERGEKTREYIDEGCSGGNTNREGFLKMMRDIEHGKIKKVIVYKLDRISRSLNDFVGILQTFKDHHVEFISSQESFDTSSIYGDLILKILIVFAEFERTSIINRVRDAYAKRTDMGLYMGGRHQYGFTLQETKQNGIKTKMYLPVQEAIEHIKYIFEMYAQEQVSLRQVLANLVANGIKPLEGKAWTTAKLSTLLKNPVYVKADSEIYDYFDRHHVRIVNEIKEFDGTKAVQLYGRTTHNPALADWSDMKLVLMRHDGVIPADLWLKCQHKIEKNKQIGNSLSNQTSWLAGKLICAKCGHTMTTIKSQRSDGSYRRYFNCTGQSHKKTCTGVKGTIYAQDMEKMVDDCIAEKLETIGNSKKTVTKTNSAELNALRLQIKEIEKQEKTLGDQLLDGSFGDALIQIANKKAEELRRQKQVILDKMSHAKEQSPEIKMTVNLLKKWRTARFEEKKAVANVLIKCIVLYEDGTPEVIWNF